MSRIEVYGASDDLIEVEGDIREEFSADNSVIAVSDGTLLRVEYTKDGVWRITMLRAGRGILNIRPNDGPDSDNYTDRAIVESTVASGPLDWVVAGSEWAHR